MPEKYQGWDNYQTWSVALIINNEEGSYEEALQLARRLRHKEDYERADAFKEWVEQYLPWEAEEEFMPRSERCWDKYPLRHLWQQLLTAALGQVDWQEIADSYHEDIKDEDETEEEDEE